MNNRIWNLMMGYDVFIPEDIQNTSWTPSKIVNYLMRTVICLMVRALYGRILPIKYSNNDKIILEFKNLKYNVSDIYTNEDELFILNKEYDRVRGKIIWGWI